MKLNAIPLFLTSGRMFGFSEGSIEKTGLSVAWLRKEHKRDETIPLPLLPSLIENDHKKRKLLKITK
jgi:hypothetical protein